MDYNTNELLEEEIEIIEIFNNELARYGHRGYCSFYENVENGYFIYKEDGRWIYQFNEQGKLKYEKRYTNICNLCLDILSDLKIDSLYYIRLDFKIPRGTRVIITKSTDCPADEVNMGIITESSIVHFGNAKPVRIYRVLGDDGKTYRGIYGLRISSDVYFRTLEDYISDTKEQIEENKEAIQELHEMNWDMFLALSDVISSKEKYLGENKIIKRK